MESMLDISQHRPLELAEGIAQTNKWHYERLSPDEVVIEITASWTSYYVHLVWRREITMLSLICLPTQELATSPSPILYELLALANQRLWMGHFDLMPNNRLSFRHTLSLRGINRVTSEQVEDLIDTAIGEFELFYPAFTDVLTNGRSPDEAIKIALFDIAGEA
jgi:hypothetical protein